MFLSQWAAKPVTLVRPVGAHADGRRVEPSRRERIQSKGRPVADEDDSGGGQLNSRFRPREQKQEDVAKADLRQHVLEGEVGLRPVLRPQEDAERHERRTARITLWPSIREKLWPFARRLAME